MDKPILQVEKVVKEYGAARVLHGVSLNIFPGELTALVGPSGSGKSTLLNIMALLDRATAGRVIVNGQDTGALTDRQLTLFRGSTIGFIFQFHHLLPAFTARENVMMPQLIKKGRPTPEMASQAAALLEKVGLQDKIDAPSSDLSGGQQQRVAIARALSGNPPLILADEPTGNLDSATSDTIFELMRTCNREFKTAFLIVTHDPRMADRCERILRLDDGRIVEDIQGPPVAPCRACGLAPHEVKQLLQLQ